MTMQQRLIAAVEQQPGQSAGRYAEMLAWNRNSICAALWYLVSLGVLRREAPPRPRPSRYHVGYRYFSVQ